MKETMSLSRDLLLGAVKKVPLILNAAGDLFLRFQVFSELEYSPLDNELSWGGELSLNTMFTHTHTYAHSLKGTLYSTLMYQ